MRFFRTLDAGVLTATATAAIVVTFVLVLVLVVAVTATAATVVTFVVVAATTATAFVSAEELFDFFGRSIVDVLDRADEVEVFTS